MRRSLWITILLAPQGFDAYASDAVESILKQRSIAEASAPARISTLAPFTSARDPLPELMLREEQERRVVSRGGGSTCQYSGQDLCYDLADRRIVYRPVRRYMPKFEGLTPENVSLRHDRIVIKYSFR